MRKITVTSLVGEASSLRHAHIKQQRGDRKYGGVWRGISQNGVSVILNNTTVSRNRSDGGINAAGIVIYGGTLQLNNATVTENYGNTGLGVSGGVITIRNTILAGNDPDGTRSDCGGAIPNGAITARDITSSAPGARSRLRQAT